MNQLNKHQRGDTIVEVLICMAILGFVISAAYSLTTRNQTATQKAQERAVATKIAESQLEMLKAYADKNPLPNHPINYFCLREEDPASGMYTPNPSGIKMLIFPNPPRVNIVQDGIDFATNYHPECQDGFYQIAMWSPLAAGAIGGRSILASTDPSTYVVTVRWDSADGKGRDEVKLFYAVYDTGAP